MTSLLDIVAQRKSFPVSRGGVCGGGTTGAGWLGLRKEGWVYRWA